MARFFKKSAKGFTLVELLIVVAIIGVLSTIGVPTFRKMVTKAKKSEAKVSLGGLFTVESAFFTEYNTYGNHLDKVGFEIEGSQRLYHVGFPGTACANATLEPSLQSVKDTLNAAYPSYYTGTRTVSPRQTAGTTVNGGGTFECFIDSVTLPPSTVALPVGVPDTGVSFLASATGNIAPGILPTQAVANGCTTNCQDVWLINQARNLNNVVDGTN